MPTKRGTSWQGVVYHKDLAGGRARRNFDNEKAAKAWELESKSRLLKGEPIDMGENVAQSERRRSGLPYTLLELVEHVSSSRWKGTAGFKSQTANAVEIAKLIGPNKPVADVNKADIDRARGKLLDQGNAPATVNRKSTALATCFTEAVHMGLIPGKPVFSRYKEAEHRIRRFTPEEEATALDWFTRMGELDMVDFIALSLDTGLRQGEMLALRHRDADGRVVHVWGTGAKSGKTRSVPLTARARGILERRKGRPGDPVFEMTRFALSWQWEKLAQALGLTDDPQFVPHIMRHEFCSRLADKDMNAAVIQQLAGHSTLAITQRYIHVRADHLVRAINALEAA
jgi:integrase